jgi:hypothetical protein
MGSHDLGYKQNILCQSIRPLQITTRSRCRLEEPENHSSHKGRYHVGRVSKENASSRGEDPEK